MMTYGYSVKENDDHLVETVEAAANGFSESLEPGAFLVDVIPSRESYFLPSCVTGDANHGFRHFAYLQTVRYVPDWFPGTGWKVKAKRFRRLLDEMADTPFQFVKDQMVSLYGIECRGLSAPSAIFFGLRDNKTAAVNGTVLSFLIPIRWGLVSECVDISCCRLPAWPFRATHLNCLTTRMSLQRPRIISSGRLLRFMREERTL